MYHEKAYTTAIRNTIMNEITRDSSNKRVGVSNFRISEVATKAINIEACKNSLMYAPNVQYLKIPSRYLLSILDKAVFVGVFDFQTYSVTCNKHIRTSANTIPKLFGTTLWYSRPTFLSSLCGWSLPNPSALKCDKSENLRNSIPNKYTW
mmetsp:Transcript_20561/g.20297  ORF Transcript_20561/g.20297 Transcript_20561/m.20297 type:complete len:150 (-) Transcript_20561:197-646(-)